MIRCDFKNILYHKLSFLITDENVSTIYYTAQEKIEFVVMENKTTHGICNTPSCTVLHEKSAAAV